VLESVLREGEQRRSLPVEFVNELAPRIGDIHVAKGISRDAYRLRELPWTTSSHAELSDEFQSRHRRKRRFRFRRSLRATGKSRNDNARQKTRGGTPNAKGHTQKNLSHLGASVTPNHVRWNALINACAFAAFEASSRRLASRGGRWSGASRSRAERARHC